VAAAAVYVVTTTLGPQFDVSQAEYEQLVEQNLVASLDAVVTPPDPIVISTTEPQNPPIGLVWANPAYA
jgi:hypothetical protein